MLSASGRPNMVGGLSRPNTTMIEEEEYGWYGMEQGVRNLEVEGEEYEEWYQEGGYALHTYQGGLDQVPKTG